MAELLIRGGTIVDGTGAPSFVGDIAIDNGKIVAVGASLEIVGQEEVDATGLHVTPGWVDCHTHYDAQIGWDATLSPSCWHGVTTVVMGNCGVTFAPCWHDDHDFLIECECGGMPAFRKCCCTAVLGWLTGGLGGDQ
jgi:N-acyl-D-amino-acid deacylase